MLTVPCHTQVALEFALLYPEKAHQLVLLNGSHGHAFDTAFQPNMRLPMLGNLNAEFVSLLQRNPHYLRRLRDAITPALKHVLLPLYVRLFGSARCRKVPCPFCRCPPCLYPPCLFYLQVLGPNYLGEFWSNYMSGLHDSDPRNLEHFLYTFQEINSHSVYHLLPKIEQPTLVVSGFFDGLLPPLVSQEIATRVRHGTHVCDPWSTHATVLESPEWTIHHVFAFLQRGGLSEVELSRQRDRKSL